MTEREPDLPIRVPRTIEVDFTRFNRVADRHGWMVGPKYDYARIAYELGISERQAYRVLDREGRPGGLFLGGFLTADEEVDFRSVFRIVRADDPIGKD
jgi:hypothetical protein